MTHDMTMWRAWRFVGSRVRRSFAPIVAHHAARARFARMRALVHFAEACLPCSQVLLSLLRYYLASARMLPRLCRRMRIPSGNCQTCVDMTGTSQLCNWLVQTVKFAAA